jgi:hypothetical protein
VAVASQEGSPALLEAQRAVTAAQRSFGQARSLAQQMADLGRELRELRETNHFQQSFRAMLREQGRG